MLSYYKRTKIIATLGPAITQDLWTLKDLSDPKKKVSVKKAYDLMEGILKAGVNTVRLNFSHGTTEEQLVRIQIARDVAKKLDLNLSIMLDTKGPEIRVGKIANKQANIKIGSKITIYTTKEIEGNATKFSVTDSSKRYNMAKDVEVGKRILVDDGKLELLIQSVDVNDGKIVAKALNNHTLISNKRINLPDTFYSLPFLSDKDRQDILFAVDHKLDYIAASFVNSASNVHEIRELLDKNGGENIQIISKIESTHAIVNIDHIIDASNGIMIARGDLALEIPFYDVPYWEKYIIRKCRYIGKPTIVATQMLDSLEKNIQPTRAEVTDVFFAVERGTDCTMLSGESANGMFPIEAVTTMSRINVKSELLFDYKRAYNFYFPKADLPKHAKKIARHIAKKIMPFGSDVAPSFPYEFVFLFTNDKQIIWTVSNIRPAATIINVTDQVDNLRCFGINYAIQTHYVKNLKEAQNNYLKVAFQALKRFDTNKQIKALIYLDHKFIPISYPQNTKK